MSQPVSLPYRPPLVVVSATGAPSALAITVLNPQSGKQLWHFTSVSGTLDMLPVAQRVQVIGSTVYITSDDATGAGYLYALQLDSGKQLWRVPLSAPAGAACLAADSHAAYIFAPRAATNGATLAAYAATNGKRVWQTGVLPYQACLGLKVPTMTFANTWLLLQADQLDGGSLNLLAFDAATGKPRWNVPTNAYAGSVTITNDRIFFDDGKNVVALDAMTGDQLWVRHGVPGTKLTLVGDTLIAFSYPTCTACPKNFVPTDTLTLLDVTNGAQLWQRQWHGTLGQPFYNVGFANDAHRLYLIADAQIQAIGLRSNSVAWSHSTYLLPQLFVQGELLFGTWTPAPTTHSQPSIADSITARRTLDGASVWTTFLPMNEAREGVIAVTDGLVLVSAADPSASGPISLTALDPLHGSTLWHAPVSGVIQAILPAAGAGG